MAKEVDPRGVDNTRPAPEAHPFTVRLSGTALCEPHEAEALIGGQLVEPISFLRSAGVGINEIAYDTSPRKKKKKKAAKKK